MIGARLEPGRVEFPCPRCGSELDATISEGWTLRKTVRHRARNHLGYCAPGLSVREVSVLCDRIVDGIDGDLEAFL